MYVGDTIAAIATAPGRGGIGIVRLSGPRSRELAESVFRPQRAGAWSSHTLRHGWLVEGECTLDEALGVWMRAGASYTGEDVVELQAHGSPAVLRRVVEALLASGARLAEPGEFTERAFLNGRLDLAQAEAVADLIDARGARAAEIAAAQLHGGLSESLGAVRAELIELKALLEVQLDFAEEDVAIDAAEIEARRARAAQTLAGLVDSYAHGKRARDGVRVAIVGRPNVGKSSLLNALLGEERAIVTEIAGTTRDVIDESIEVAGIPMILSDTPGLRAETADQVERIGVERTAAAIQRADGVLLVVDASRPLTGEDEEALRASAAARRLVVANKSDLGVVLAPNELRERTSADVVVVSARSHAGLNELRGALARMLGEEEAGGSAAPVLTRERHRHALQHAGDALALAQRGLRDGAPPEIVAVSVQEALDHVGEVTGAVSNEDVLDEIFRRFCLGK